MRVLIPPLRRRRSPAKSEVRLAFCVCPGPWLHPARNRYLMQSKHSEKPCTQEGQRWGSHS
nr:MAG TPA: hypothetical protein [Caudoviricetes sp.]